MVLTKKGLTTRLARWLDMYRFYICRGSDFKKSNDVITVLINSVLDCLKNKISVEDLYKSTHNLSGFSAVDNYEKLEDVQDVFNDAKK